MNVLKYSKEIKASI